MRQRFHRLVAILAVIEIDDFGKAASIRAPFASLKLVVAVQIVECEVGIGVVRVEPGGEFTFAFQ